METLVFEGALCLKAETAFWHSPLRSEGRGDRAPARACMGLPPALSQSRENPVLHLQAFALGLAR